MEGTSDGAVYAVSNTTETVSKPFVPAAFPAATKLTRTDRLQPSRSDASRHKQYDTETILRRNDRRYTRLHRNDNHLRRCGQVGRIAATQGSRVQCVSTTRHDHLSKTRKPRCLEMAKCMENMVQGGSFCRIFGPWSMGGDGSEGWTNENESGNGDGRGDESDSSLI